MGHISHRWTGFWTLAHLKDQLIEGATKRDGAGWEDEIARLYSPTGRATPGLVRGLSGDDF